MKLITPTSTGGHKSYSWQSLSLARQRREFATNKNEYSYLYICDTRRSRRLKVFH